VHGARRKWARSQCTELPAPFRKTNSRMPNAAQRLLRGAELRKLIDVPRVSFESMMRKRARTALAMFSGRSAGVQRCAPLTRGV